MAVEQQEYEHAVTMRAHWHNIPQESPIALNPFDFAVPVDDRPLSEWYAAWMTLRQDAHNALDILLSLTYGQNAFLQSDLLVVALGAETLHRDLYPGCLATYPAEFGAMMTKPWRSWTMTKRNGFSGPSATDHHTKIGSVIWPNSQRQRHSNSPFRMLSAGPKSLWPIATIWLTACAETNSKFNTCMT